MSDSLYDLFKLSSNTNENTSSLLERRVISDDLNNTYFGSIDCLIMENFSKGLLYFSEVLKRYNTHEYPDEANYYLQNYIKTFLKNVIKISEIQFLINSNPDFILNFHHQIVASKMDIDIIHCWFDLLYKSLLKIYSKQFHQIKDSIIIKSILECNEFLKFLNEFEISENRTAEECDSFTIIGVLIKYMDDDPKLQILERIIYPLIYQYDNNGYSHFTKWLILLQKKNKRRSFVQQPDIRLSNDQFMLNTLRFVLYLWKKNYREFTSLEDIENMEGPRSIMINCCYRQIELTILPIFTKYNYYLNRLDDFNQMTSSYNNYNNYSYLNRLKDNLLAKINDLKFLIRDNITITYHNTLSFYSWIVSYLVNNNNIEYMSETISILVSNIFQFVIYSYSINKYLFEKEETQVNSIIKLALYVLTLKFKTKNPHLQIMAFRCFYQLEYSLKNYKITDEQTLFTSIVNLYIKSNQLSDDEYFICPKMQLITFLEEHQELYKYRDSIDKPKLERFINIVISDINYYFENYYTKAKKIYNNEYITISNANLNYLKKILRKISDHFRVVRNFVAGIIEIETIQIFNSLATCLIFNTRHINKLNELLNCYTGPENETSIHREYLYKLSREITKTYLHFITNPHFKENIFSKNQDFCLESTKLVFSLSKMDGLRCLNEFIEIATDKLVNNLDDEKEIDYPLEFLDPLIFTLINDPVVLPKTNTIMERSVIERQLLEKSENPFDRSELTLENLNSYNLETNTKTIIDNFNNRFEKWYTEYQMKNNVNNDNNDNNENNVDKKSKDGKI